MKALLIAVNYQNINYDVNNSIEELKSLCFACDIEVGETIIQNLEKINPVTYIGSGKTQDILKIVDDYDMIIFDDELSPIQVKNLSNIFEQEVTDRTDLILRIFETRAKTKEAKLQIEIARDQYLLPRLIGMQAHMSHQQGGSGFRGSGEKQIELDRRVIARRLHKAREQLKQIVLQRQTQRKKRKNNGLSVVALVGYTNSGKSTLLNCFALEDDKKVFQKDMLFATLQTATRDVRIHNHQCLLTDTVGFIDRLPHHLVQAFRSTLEEVVEADLLIHVVDSSDDDYQRHINTTNSVLESLGVKDTPMIYAYNKVDLNKYGFINPEDPYVFISAKDRVGLELLEDEISRVLFKDYFIYELEIPYESGEVFKYLHQHCLVLEFNYLDNYIYLKIEANQKEIKPYLKYLIKH